MGERERELKEANLRRVRSVEKERDEARSQVQNLRKERLLERLFSEAEGRVGGDERGTFFDTFVTLCGGHFQLGDVDGRQRPPGPLPRSAHAEEGPWGDRGHSPRHFRGFSADSPWRLGAAAA